MIELLTLILAIPLGLTLAKLTSDEKPIFTKKMYFPTILVILALTAVATFTIDKTTSYTSAFMFITTLIWLKA